MPVPTSNISMQDLNNEFGLGYSLGNYQNLTYYVNGNAFNSGTSNVSIGTFAGATATPPGPSITNTDYNENSAGNRSSYTWSNLNFGSNTSNKYVFVIIQWVNGFNTRTVQDLRIGGSTATYSTIGSGFASVSYVCGFRQVSSTSGDVFIRWNNNTANFPERIFVWEWHEATSYSLSIHDTEYVDPPTQPLLQMPSNSVAFAASVGSENAFDGFSDNRMTVDVGGSGTGTGAGHSDFLTSAESNSQIAYVDYTTTDNGARIGAVAVRKV